MIYETIPIPTNAWQAPSDLIINGLEAKRGEWIVTSSAGQVTIYSDKDFKAKYRAIHVCPIAQWNWSPPSTVSPWTHPWLNFNS